MYLRQWSGLINVHKSKVAKQLLLPLGGRYFEGNVLKGLEDTDGKKRTHLLVSSVLFSIIHYFDHIMMIQLIFP